MEKGLVKHKNKVHSESPLLRISSLFKNNQTLSKDTSGWTSGKGFTLIELLVVVLIIGILSAIALPQYQKSVEKARAAEAFSTLKTLYNAQEVFYLSNGHYATDFAELDIQAPNSNFFDYHMDSMSVFASSKKGVYTISFRFLQAILNGADSIVCYASTGADTETAKAICKSLGADVSSGIRWKIK